MTQNTLYTPPGVTVQTRFDTELPSTPETQVIPVFIGEGNETLTQVNLEVVRGSSSIIDQQINKEDEAERAVVSVSATNVVTLGSFDGVKKRFQVRNFPIVRGDGTGTVSNERSSVVVTINNSPIVVTKVLGDLGIVELAQAPKSTDVVRCSYFYKRRDTLFTDDVSDQVSTSTAYVRAITGIGDEDAPNDQGVVLDIHGDILNDQGEVLIPANNVLNLIVDGEEVSLTLPDSETYTMQGVANAIDSLSSSISLTASTFFNNYGFSALQLNADQDLEVLDGSANAVLGLVEGSVSTRRKTFYTFQGPIVDGTNGGVTTTNPNHVTVKVDNVKVKVVSVEGSSRAITLEKAPIAGSTVKITYYANTWQNTYDDLRHADVTSILSCGDTPDSDSYTEEADFVLAQDRIQWGSAWDVNAVTTTANKEPFDDTQVRGLLVDYRNFAQECTRVSNKTFQLPLDPTLGNGRDTSLGSSLFQDSSNGKIDVPANRPDVVWVYWGYDVQDAFYRGRVEVVSVEGNIVTLRDEIPVGAKVFATFYYNSLTDAEYVLTCVNPGPSGVGSYSITDTEGDPIYAATYSTSSKGSALTGVTVAFPSGSELVPDLRFEGVSGTSFQGPVNEIVTVEFDSRNPTPAKLAVEGFGPYSFVEDESDRAVVNFSGTDSYLALGIDLTRPTGASGWEGGFLAHLVGDEVVYSGGSGSVVGESYTLTSDEIINLKVDGLDVKVYVSAGSAKTIDDYVSAINTAVNGHVGLASSGSTSTIVFPNTVPGHGVVNNFVGWVVSIGVAGATADNQRRTITAYNASTRTATVDSNWTTAAVASNDPFRLFNPDTSPYLRGTTKFTGSIDLTGAKHLDFAFHYVGDSTGALDSGAITLTDQVYDTVEDLVSEIQDQLDTIITSIIGGDNTYSGFRIFVEADNEGRLLFKLEPPVEDTTGYFAFHNDSIALEDSFMELAGFDVSDTIGKDQTVTGVIPVAKAYTLTHTDSQRPHDRLILRNRILPGDGGAIDSTSFVEQAGIEVVSGSGLAKAGLSIGQVGLCGQKSVVKSATLASSLSFADGWSATTSEPVVIFFDGTGAQSANNVFEFTMDGVAVQVVFDASDTGTSTDLGPISDNTTILGQIVAAMENIPGQPFGDASAIEAAFLVRSEGVGIRLTSAQNDSTSVIVIGEGSANNDLGFSGGQVAQLAQVPVALLASALNSNRHNTFSTMLHDFEASTSNYFAHTNMGLATVVKDEANREYLFLQQAASSTANCGPSSTITIKDPLVSSVVTDSWLAVGTGIASVNGDSAQGDPAIDGFFVTSNNVNGSGTANDSVLNDGTGQDGVVGQTYRDKVTGLTFTILPRGWHDNTQGPWISYPTGSNATLRFVVSSTILTNANLPNNAIPGLELRVVNTYNVGSGDTALLKTFERGGAEPAIGDLYYVSYTYRKDDFETKFFVSLSDIEREYGQPTPDSPVSLAANLAFINGATIVGVKQVPREEGSDFASVQSYKDAIVSLEGKLNNRRPGIIIPLRTDSTDLYQYLKVHNNLQSMHTNKAERTSIIGMSSGATVQDAIDLATTLSNDRMCVVYPETLILENRDAFGTVREYFVDGAYLAAALAGSIVSNAYDVASPWLNRKIVGFKQIAQKLSPVEMNRLAQNGVIVFEPDFGTVLKVRDAFTTDRTNIFTEEPTIRQIVDFVQIQTRAVCEPFIGRKNVGNLTSQIEGRLSTMFKGLVAREIIKGYKGIKASVDPTNPRLINVTAYYAPVFPLKYIEVRYTVRANL